MPAYLNLTLSLISQFDAMSLPEFQPPLSDPIDPFSSHPALISESQPIVSVYIPTYPCSTFWLSYSILPPHPSKSLYYFKLFVSGTHIVSWGCGEKENYTGKTMFGLFREPQGGLQRRVLSFASEDNGRQTISSEMMEVRVYRSKGRRRIEAEVEEFKTGVDGVSKAKQLSSAGIRYWHSSLTVPTSGNIADAQITQLAQCRLSSPSQTSQALLPVRAGRRARQSLCRLQILLSQLGYDISPPFPVTFDFISHSS